MSSRTTPEAPTGRGCELPGPDVAGSRGPDGVAELLAAAGRLERGGPASRWVVRGGPGTGRTLLLTRTVRAVLGSGFGLDEVLVLVHSARAAAQMSETLTAGGMPVAATGPAVRTVHSLAYGIVRLAAARQGAEPPRLMTGAEHDVVLRETLAGELADGAGDWPHWLRPALSTVGFARELRDLLLRSVERGIDPDRLAELGREAGVEQWRAAAEFFIRHSRQLELRAGSRPDHHSVPPALNASELVGAALEAVDADPDLLADVRSRVVVAVDDAHHLDPLSAELVARVGGGARLLVVAEDPAQSVFRFRGAGGGLARAVAEQGGRELRLHTGWRMASEPARLAHRVAERLPGRPPGFDVPPDAPAGTARVRVLSSASAEAAAVADFLRRRHVVDGIPWSRMAVLTRSLPRVADQLMQALDAAGVPVADLGAEIPPSHDPVVAALLAILASTAVEPTAEEAAALLAGPLGAADPVALRRLRRGIRRSGVDGGVTPSDRVVLRWLLADPAQEEPWEEALTSVEAAPLRRLRTVRGAVVAARAAGAGVEEVLWSAWHASGQERRLAGAARAEDAWARQADRSLDAVIALFDHAADFVDRNPGGSPESFVADVTARDLPASRRADGRVEPEGVAVLSAHSAVGGQWDAVAVCGVQDGIWPAGRRRGGLLGVDELVDLTETLEVSGAVPPRGERETAATAARAAEERRLFLVACSRARVHLLITAVQAPETGDAVPSRFVDELLEMDPPPAGAEAGRGPLEAVAPGVFSLRHLVAELRVVAADPATDPAEAGRAAGLLAHLSREGVEPADPRTWYGIAEPTTGPAAEPGGEPPVEPVVLSPSAFGTVEQCPLSWFLGGLAGTGESTGALVRGSVLHVVAQAVAGGVAPEDVESTLRRHWPRVTAARGVFARRELDRLVAASEAMRAWQAGSRHEYTLAGVEVPFRMDTGRVAAGRPIVVRGRIDRIERTPDEALVAVDIKTSPAAATKAEAAAHPQLEVYQLAVASGTVGAESPEGALRGEPGGGVLLYPAVRARSAALRHQPALAPAAREQLLDRLELAGAAQLGPRYPARPGRWCEHCRVRTSCPAVAAGGQVIA